MPNRSRSSRKFREDALPALAREIAGRAGPGAWILLEGPLGSGKSTLARALLREWGCALGESGSPTFPLVREYRARDGSLVAHADLYRMEREEDLAEIGLEALSLEPAVRVLLEWPDRFPEWSARLPRALRVRLSFDPQDSGARFIEIGENS